MALPMIFDYSVCKKCSKPFDTLPQRVEAKLLQVGNN